jgi:hypothetical protein
VQPHRETLVGPCLALEDLLVDDRAERPQAHGEGKQRAEQRQAEAPQSVSQGAIVTLPP